MLRILSFLSFFVLPVLLAAQLSGRTWVAGYDEFPGTPGFGRAVIHLQGDTVSVVQQSLAFNFESTSAVATDTTGQLLFYSNGCSVANRLHMVMPNGMGLNPGDIAEQVCPELGYIVPQGAMVLPDPGNTERFYLFHTGAAYDPVHKLDLGPLYYSVVDMSLDGGLGDIISKNNSILSGAALGAFTAVRHGNGRDWWVIVSSGSDQYWFTFLITPTGVTTRPVQVIGFMLPACEKQGALTVSPDGSHLAKWGECKVLQLDFDRCSGIISHSLEIPTPTQWIPGGGLAYSPSGRYLYATSHNVLFRADMEVGTAHFDTLRFSYDPFLASPYFVRGNTFHQLINGADGRIYGNIPSRARQLHIIDNPEAASNEELIFLPRGLQLPVTNVRTLPHFPNFRLYDAPGSLCDTLEINSPVSTYQIHNLCDAGIKLYPNPATDMVHIGLADCDIQRIRVMNALGYEVKVNLTYFDASGASIQVGHLPPGLYVVALQSFSGHWMSRTLTIIR